MMDRCKAAGIKVFYKGIDPKEREKMTKAPDEPTITISSTYRRTVQPAQYETAVAEVTVSETFLGSVSPEDIAQQSQSQFEIIKSEVLLQLGRDFEQDETTGRIMELFPNAVVVESKPSVARPVRAIPAARTPPSRAAQDRLAALEDQGANDDYNAEVYDEPEEPAPQRRAPRAPRPVVRSAPAPRARATEDDPDGHWQDLMENPGQWWDNQDNKPNPKGPDFTHKSKKEGNYKLGLWLRNAPSWFKDPYS
jgi:hypothetical protein